MVRCYPAAAVSAPSLARAPAAASVAFTRRALRGCVALAGSVDEEDDEYDSADDDELPHDLDAEAFGSIDPLQVEVLCTQLAKIVDLLRTSRRRSSVVSETGGASSFMKMVCSLVGVCLPRMCGHVVADACGCVGASVIR